MTIGFEEIIRTGVIAIGALFVVFILFWIIVPAINQRGALRYRQQSTDYLTAHLAELRRQNDLLDRIASALEKFKSS